MKKILFWGAALLLAACSTPDYRDASLPPATRAKALLAQMTLEEKVGQMCQYVGPCYVPPGEGSAHGNVDATDENLGHPDMAEKIREGKVGSFLHVLSGEEAAGLQRIASESRLGIPLLLGVDAIHGNALHEGCTIYPTNINMASTFNPAMMEQIGAETAQEMRRTGMYWTFAPNLDVARDARWGRMGETYGEDPLLVSEMGKHLIWGLQGRDGVYGEDHVLACAKHLIAGGEPFGGINAAPMDLSERKLREVFLPPFVAAVKDAHVATFMAAHNEINGIPCHGNSWLLKDLLRDELGFDGFVVSDWMDIERMHLYHHWMPSVEEAFRVSVEAGIDMHMQGDGYFETIVEAVRNGRIPERRINEAAGKILETKFALGLFEAYPSVAVAEDASSQKNAHQRSSATAERTVLSPEMVRQHRETALEAARQGLVLLKNDGTLPLCSPAQAGERRGAYPLFPCDEAPSGWAGTKVRKLFVCGPNADSQTILGDWAAPQPADNVVTVLEGIRDMAPGVAVDTLCFGGKIGNITDDRIRLARAKAASADVNILVLGENSQRYSAFGRTCGENCDRDNIDLPGRQEELLEAVQAAGKPVVLVLLTGRALGLTWAEEHVNAILNAWEPGMMGGQAVAEVLFGQVNPSGKLPVTVPRNVGQIPTIYNYKPMQYSRQFVLNETGALYPFGFGLSYTTFSYSAPSFIADAATASTAVAGTSSQNTRENALRCDTAAVAVKDLPVRVCVEVTNSGVMDGDEVVQLYVRDEYASVTRPVKELKAFRRVHIPVGESVKVEFEITPEMLACWSGKGDVWTVEPGEFTLMVGSSSADKDLQTLTLHVD